MSQTRAHSALESVANVAIGYGVAVVSQIAILPLFGVRLPLADNLAIGAWFTAISLVRSYAVRRLFNTASVNAEKQPIQGVKDENRICRR